MLSYSEFSERALSTCRVFAIITAIAAPISTAVASVAMVAVIITWLLTGKSLQTLKESFQHPVGKTILLFYAWLIIGCLYADNTWSAKFTTLLSWQKLLFAFLLLGVFNNQKWQQRFVYSYLGFMSVASLVGLGLWLLEINPKHQEIGIFMTNYATQSTAFIAALLCAVFLVKSEKNWQQVALWLFSVLFLVNIFIISPARSAYLAVPPAILMIAIYLYGYKKLPHILATVVIALLVVSLSSQKLQDRIKLGFAEQASYQTSEKLTSVGTRLIFYSNTLELIKEKPVFGYGTSSFGNTYEAHVAEKYQDWRAGKTTDPHNQYLFIWLENGIPGLILFFIYIVTAIRFGLRRQLPYGAIAASLLLAITASSLFNSHFKTFAEGNLLAFFIGALLAIPKDKKAINHA